VTTSKEIDREDARLSGLGFDSAAPAADAIARLGELSARPDAPIRAIARALGRIADPQAAAMLAGMEPKAGGALRREIRRSLFKLRQRGIAPPPSQAQAALAARVPEPSGLSALLSPIDAEGARLVWIVKSRAQGGVIRLWGIVSEVYGLVGANVTALSRRELRSEREELERRVSARLVDADWRLADFVLCEAYRATPADRRALVGNFLALRAELISSPPPVEFAHPVYGELRAEAAEEPSIELLKEPEFIEWKLPAAQVGPWVEEFNRASESVIVLNPLQQRERAELIVQRALGALLSGDSAQKIRRRLEDIAYFMARSGRRRQAGWAAAAAAKIRDGADLTRVQFFQAFIRTQLATTVAAEQERAREEPRLIMTPAEAMRAREARMRQRRP